MSSSKSSRSTCAASPIEWKNYQVAAADRIVRRCRYQRGFLLVHSMGSGKTLTSLYVLRNLHVGHKWLIVLPKGLDSEWIKEFYSFVGYKQPSAGQQETQEMLSRRTVAERMLANTDFISYKEIGEKLSGSGKDLIELFRDRYVVCDEAHRLLNLLRSQPQQSEEDEEIGNVRPLDRAFSAAKRVLLVTGTPVQKSWGDLAVLVNLAAGSITVPPLESAFLQQFAKDTSWWQYGLSLGGFGSNVAAPMLTKVVSLVGTAEATKMFAKDYLPWVFGTVASVASSAATGWIGSVVGAFGSVAGFVTAYNPYIQAGIMTLGVISYLNTKYNKILVDAAKVAGVIGPYVSYYDFLSDPSNLAAVPQKTVEKVLLPYTNFQVMQFVKLAHDAGTSSMSEFRIASRIAEDDRVGGSIRNIDAREDFIRLGRVIGNLSEFNLMFGTRRVGDASTPLEQRVYAAYMYDTEAVAAQARPEDRAGLMHAMRELRERLGANVPEGVFSCPKYIDVLGKLVEERKRSTRLPVVYSCFDKYGFQTFSAFLTSWNVPHYVIHPADNARERQRLIEACNQEHALWNEKGLMDKATPLCVLLHPTLTEGLSFTLNPSMYVLEQPFGYGVQEQVYARVVRTLNSKVVSDLKLTPTKRLQKKVYQYVCTNSSVTIPLSRWLSGLGVADFRVFLPFWFVNVSKDGPQLVQLEKVKIGSLKLETTTPGLDEKSQLRRRMGLPVLSSADGSNHAKKVFEVHRDFWLPWITINLRVTAAPVSTILYNVAREWMNSKAVKDVYTEYLEGYKQDITTTADEMAEATNVSQAFMFGNLGTEMTKQKDVMPPVGLGDGERVAQCAADVPDTPEDVKQCEFYKCVGSDDEADPKQCASKEEDPAPLAGGSTRKRRAGSPMRKSPKRASKRTAQR